MLVRQVVVLWLLLILSEMQVFSGHVKTTYTQCL